MTRACLSSAIAAMLFTACDGEGHESNGRRDASVTSGLDAAAGPGLADAGDDRPSGGAGRSPGIPEGWSRYACCRWGCNPDLDTSLYSDFAIPAAMAGAIGSEGCVCGSMGWQSCDTDPCDPNDSSTGPVCMFGVIAPEDGGAWSDEPSSNCPHTSADHCDALLRCVEENGLWAQVEAAGIDAPICGEDAAGGREGDGG